MILPSDILPSIADASLIAAPAARCGTGRIKTLHLVNGEHFAGAERVQDLIAQSIPQFGYEVGFACLKPDQFPKLRQARDCELFDARMQTRFDLRCVRQVVRLFRQNEFRLLHAHTPRTLMIGHLAARWLKCPLVYHVHSPVSRDSDRGVANQVNTWIETWSLKHVDRMICVSQSLGNYMAQLGHPEDRISVVANGVAIRTELPQRQTPTGTWTLGTMALFRPRKGTEVLLEALAILKKQKLDVRLRAVGSFESAAYEAEVHQRAVELGVADMIQWTGFQTDVDKQLQQMDLFVLPSLYGEGLPMVVLEAMANGVPVVASRVEGIPEALRDQVDGMIFEPGDPESLAECLSHLIRQPRLWQPMSQCANKRQREKLSDVTMARGVATVYDSLLGRTPIDGP